MGMGQSPKKKRPCGSSKLASSSHISSQGGWGRFRAPCPLRGPSTRQQPHLPHPPQTLGRGGAGRSAALLCGTPPPQLCPQGARRDQPASVEPGAGAGEGGRLASPGLAAGDSAETGRDKAAAQRVAPPQPHRVKKTELQHPVAGGAGRAGRAGGWGANGERGTPSLGLPC